MFKQQEWLFDQQQWDIVDIDCFFPVGWCGYSEKIQ